MRKGVNTMHQRKTIKVSIDSGRKAWLAKIQQLEFSSVARSIDAAVDHLIALLNSIGRRGYGKDRRGDCLFESHFSGV